ncbi:MAG: hypothetical protein K0S33_830 [Bacteroidetes bacterium]|nr:hypothetical protein [Bacteroidota bacterium]
MFAFFILIATTTIDAQKKPQKPIKLQAKTDNHKISFEMETDIFYFTNMDLIGFFKQTGDNTTGGAVNYLDNYHKTIEYKKGQTNFKNAGERSLHAAIEKYLKNIVLAGKAADIAKDGNKMNLFILTIKCTSDSTKETITEKKGRVVLECL